MRRRRTLAAVIAATVVASGCSDGGSGASAPPASATTTTAEPVEAAATVTSFGRDCAGIDQPPPVGVAEITFVRDGTLYAMGAGATDARCLLAGVDPDLRWGAAGDRLLAGEAAFVAPASAVDAVLTGTSAFTRPTGTSVVSIEDGGRRVVKTAVDGGGRTDISFLAHHAEVVYHPAGLHVLAIGTDAAGAAGIWLATNQGADPRLLTEAPADTRLHHLAVADDGASITFAADHEGVSHVHRAWLPGDAVELEEQQALALLESRRPFSAVEVGPDGEVAAVAGPCDDGPELVTTEPVALGGLPPGSAVPAGWLTESELLVLVADDGCPGSAPADLWLVAGDDPPLLLVTDVEAAAARRASGEPPPPPEEGVSGFA